MEGLEYLAVKEWREEKREGWRKYARHEDIGADGGRGCSLRLNTRGRTVGRFLWVKSRDGLWVFWSCARARVLGAC